MSKTINEYSLVEVMEKIEQIVNENSAPIDGYNASYQFDISGEEEGTYQLHFLDGKATVKNIAESPADCTLGLSLNNFHLFLLGKLNGTVAFMTGKLKIKGDIGKAIKLEGILRKYNVKDHL